MTLATLFRPFSTGALDLRTRLVMAPMTRGFSPGGVPGDDVAAYYRRRAENEVGLIVTEGTAVDHPSAVSNPAIPRFHGEKALSGWAAVVREVHAAGGRIFPQLWHVGGAFDPAQFADPGRVAVSPSGLRGPGQPAGRALDEAEIAGLIDAYGQAAADALSIGFDGIELHFAHGYLADQFFWRETNLRDDIWGRDRTRFAAEIVRECRRRTRRDFPICLRFSQWKLQNYDARPFATPADLEAFLKPLADAGVDMFHCSSRRFWTPEFDGSPMNLAGWTKRLTRRPVIVVGSVGLDQEFLVSRTGVGTTNDRSRFDLLDAMLARDEIDLVAVGRALIADPAWGRKARQGRFDAVLPYSKAAEAVLA
ncbi:NADH:flavin oxidoreductase [Sphingomonas sp.]|uniref:NADH:flavin oxidoreductase n=1 Tax=Sphingomonas sp. TaxID=28214 RepID=UPI002DD647F2|nr:NADH:flavin oxidoreductase [Sphingomonas sp.]